MGGQGEVHHDFRASVVNGLKPHSGLAKDVVGRLSNKIELFIYNIKRRPIMSVKYMKMFIKKNRANLFLQTFVLN